MENSQWTLTTILRLTDGGTLLLATMQRSKTKRWRTQLWLRPNSIKHETYCTNTLPFRTLLSCGMSALRPRILELSFFKIKYHHHLLYKQQNSECFEIKLIRNLFVFGGIRCGWQCPGRLRVSKWLEVAGILWPCTKDGPFLLRVSALLLRLLRSVCPAGWPLPGRPSIYPPKKRKEKKTKIPYPLFSYSPGAAVICVTAEKLWMSFFILFAQARDITEGGAGIKGQKIWQGGCTLCEELMATSFLCFVAWPFSFLLLRATFHVRLTASIRRIPSVCRWRGRFSRLRHWT